jgi:hypothetical protein
MGVVDEQRHQVFACDVKGPKLKKHISRVCVIVAQEALQVLQTACVMKSKKCIAPATKCK